jgi:hypothetical protein
MSKCRFRRRFSKGPRTSRPQGGACSERRNRAALSAVASPFNEANPVPVPVPDAGSRDGGRGRAASLFAHPRGDQPPRLRDAPGPPRSCGVDHRRGASARDPVGAPVLVPAPAPAAGSRSRMTASQQLPTLHVDSARAAPCFGGEGVRSGGEEGVPTSEQPERSLVDPTVGAPRVRGRMPAAGTGAGTGAGAGQLR